MRKFLLGLLFGFLFAALAVVIVVFAAFRLSTRPPGIPNASMLVLSLQGEIPESPPVEIPLPFLDRFSRATVRDHWEILKKAAADSRIRGIVLEPDGLHVGWAKLEELRSDIETFRKSGKPVYAYLRSPGTREYYIATAADRVYLPPEDELDLKGMRIELMYVKKTLDKLGVQVEVEHAGKYKDAPDMFTRTSASPETQEVMNSILDDVFGRLVSTIAAARKKTPEQVRAIIDQGPFLARQALDSGLVDQLAYEDQVFGDLRRRLNLDAVRKVPVRNYLQIPPASVGVETGARVGFVVAEGDIIRGGDGPASDFITAREMTRLLDRVSRDNSLKGVIVRIDSPGGDAFASDEIWRAMELLHQKKPVVISMSDTAASGGYYMAMTGDPLVAYPGTLTGSIGVFYGKVDLRGLYDKIGVTKDILSRGRFANIDSDYTPLSDAARAKLRDSITSFYTSFVQRVAQGRKRTYQQIEPLAQGRVWLGSQARSIGLVDDLGGIDRAIDLIKKKAGIRAAENIRLVPYPPRRTIFDELINRPADPAADVPILAQLRRFRTAGWLDGAVFRLMPYTITIR